MSNASLRKASAAVVKPTAVFNLPATVAVVIPTFNHAHYLADAITSVLRQTRQADEIIVVDDGSHDDPESVIGRFPGVKLIRQDNRGLAAARNTGLQTCTASYVIFLDADDRLLPPAIEAGLTCFASHLDCAFVYGGYRVVSDAGEQLAVISPKPIAGDAYLAILRTDSAVAAIMTMVFRRDCLIALGGFDEALRTCEDLDLKLRVTRQYPIACHSEIVADYRRHHANMSNRHAKMLEVASLIINRQPRADQRVRRAMREGLSDRRNYYVSRMFGMALADWHSHRDVRLMLKEVVEAMRRSPFLTLRLSLRAVRGVAKSALAFSLLRVVERIRRHPNRIPVGSVRFGDLRRLTPVNQSISFGRGTPVDRYYIERFLRRNRDDIRGRVLEADDNSYTTRFGGSGLDRTDVICIENSNPRATIVGDLAQPGVLPEEAFDCIILTQVLQYVFDLTAAVVNLCRALKPGGVLLVTAPGISKIELYKWQWYWGFTAPALSRLLETQFGRDGVSVETYGNVFAATAFLHGIAAEELDFSELNTNDKDYPVLVAARAIKLAQA